jgi:hypothetical protein
MNVRQLSGSKGVLRNGSTWGFPDIDQPAHGPAQFQVLLGRCAGDRQNKAAEEWLARDAVWSEPVSAAKFPVPELIQGFHSLF